VAETDLILLHPPSVYDFRKRPILHGPVSDVIPSTQIFEMYPIGLMTILAYLQAHGLSVRIINVALRMLRSRRFDAERLVKSLTPTAFGIDLHWMVHAQGSLELARIVKKCHPDVPIVFGGLSASYYHEQLMGYPQVDYVVRGDSTEEPLCRLLWAIKKGGSPEDVPNLTWRDVSQVRVNDLSYIPSDLDSLSFDYRSIVRSCARHLDFFGHVPFKTWVRYPIVAALSCRGCVNNCTICGGSASAYRRICGRAGPAYRSPGLMARDMALISRYIRAPIMVLGDIHQAGDEYARDFLKVLKKERIKNHVAFEFFSPPGRELLRMMADSVPNFNIQISPESHDERIRRTFGRAYTNDSLETSITDALALGCRRVDVFFMIGVPEQTVASVRDTVGYCRELLLKYGAVGGGGRLRPFISPLAPFLDPGSVAFENPDRYGYKLFHRSLEEHRKALLAPSWKYTLNYETNWMNRDELVDVTYEAALELNRLKLEHGLLSGGDAKRIAARIAREKELIREIDGIFSVEDQHWRDKRLAEVMSGFETAGPSTLCRKDEMNWPTALVRFSPYRIIRSALSRTQEG